MWVVHLMCIQQCNAMNTPCAACPFLYPCENHTKWSDSPPSSPDVGIQGNYVSCPTIPSPLTRSSTPPAHVLGYFFCCLFGSVFPPVAAWPSLQSFETLHSTKHFGTIQSQPGQQSPFEFCPKIMYWVKVFTFFVLLVSFFFKTLRSTSIGGYI